MNKAITFYLNTDLKDSIIVDKLALSLTLRELNITTVVINDKVWSLKEIQNEYRRKGIYI